MTSAAEARSDRGVALLGLGAMGSPMADVLHRAGVRLTVWNRSTRRTERFISTHVDVAGSPAKAARPVVLTMLPDIGEVRAVLTGADGLLAGWRSDHVTAPVLVVMGTVSPVAVAELADEMTEHGVRLIDAPVSGGVLGAAEARLSIMVGGAPEDVATVAPVLALLGHLHHLGPVGTGEVAKACNQVVVAATVTALSEAVLLARAHGLDIRSLLDVLGAGLAGSEVLRQKSQHWVDEEFSPGGTSRYQSKDLRFALDAATAVGTRLPLTAQVHDLFARSVAEGEGDLDHTAIYLLLRRLSA